MWMLYGYEVQNARFLPNASDQDLVDRVVGLVLINAEE